MNERMLSYAKTKDREDELRELREEFYIKEGRIYLDGNSLGLMSKGAEQAVLNLVESWKSYGIDGWMEGDNPWFYLSENLGHQMAALVGAMPEEVIVTGSTTSNMHQLVSTFYRPEGKRTKILADSLTFPSDIYALKSQLALRNLEPGQHLVQVQSRDGRTLEEEDIIASMADDIALIVLPGVLYRSGQVLDMKRLTQAAHDRGILIGFDLCHSIGAIPHELSGWDVDFAFWCNYKYLNAGPGSVGALYVNQQHFDKVPGLAGWFSSHKEKQFDMEHTLTKADDAGAYQMGTPHIFSVAPLIGSLQLFEKAGITRLREKSLALTTYFMELIDTELKEFGFHIGNPKEATRRGGHVYLEHPEAARICKALKEEGVIPDFRSPNGIRLAPVALYNSFEDVWKAVKILKTIMENENYKKFENKRGIIA